jgi:hypothetical protein
MGRHRCGDRRDGDMVCSGAMKALRTVRAITDNAISL